MEEVIPGYLSVCQRRTDYGGFITGVIMSWVGKDGQQVDIYGPARAIKGSREEKHVSGQMPSYIRPLSEGIAYLRVLMKSALPLLNKTSASMAVSTFRVWGSRSARSWHQRDHPSHRAVGSLNLLASTS